MLALARNHITDSLDHAANDDCINGGPCNRTKYGYDALDRVTSATTTNVTDGWTYDANGNRLTQTGTAATTFSVNSTNNQLSSSSGSLARPIYVYDAAGHTQAYGSHVFTYNNRGRLMATNAGPTNYLYNALGQMIEKSGAAGTTLFMQDEAGHLIGEYDGIGNLIEETIWLGDIPVATLQFGTSALKTYYVHTDHLNTPRRITNRNTNIIVWRWDSDPFGNGAAVQNPQGTVTVTYNLRFPGQYYQAETGLSQNTFRDYDPATGKYIESDILGLKGGVNTYSYAKDAPIEWSDPLGLDPLYLIQPLIDMVRNYFPTCNKAEREYCQDFCAAKGELFVKCQARVLTIRLVHHTQIKRLWPPNCRCEPPAQCLISPLMSLAPGTLFELAPAPTFAPFFP